MPSLHNFLAIVLKFHGGDFLHVVFDENVNHIKAKETHNVDVAGKKIQSFANLENILQDPILTPLSNCVVLGETLDMNMHTFEVCFHLHNTPL